MGKELLDSFEREEKFNESREREFRRKENTRTTQPPSHEAIEAIEDTKKEKRKLFERFRASVRASVFLRAFRPQDALVFHRKIEG